MNDEHERIILPLIAESHCRCISSLGTLRLVCRRWSRIVRAIHIWRSRVVRYTNQHLVFGVHATSDPKYARLLGLATNGNATDIANWFVHYSEHGATWGQPDFRVLSRLVLRGLWLRQDTRELIRAYLQGCALLVELDRGDKIMLYGNLFCNGYWRSAHDHPMWFYFACYGLRKGIGGSEWIPDDEKLRHRPELKRYFGVFPTAWSVKHLMAWVLLDFAGFSAKEILHITELAFE